MGNSGELYAFRLSVMLVVLRGLNFSSDGCARNLYTGSKVLLYGIRFGSLSLSTMDFYQAINAHNGTEKRTDDSISTSG